MNTQTIHGLAKALRALSVFFASLSVFVIAVPLSIVLGASTVKGVHTGDMGWAAYIRFAVMFVLIGAVLFCCYLFSRRQKPSLLATVFLWSAALAAGIYAAILVLGLLRVMIQH